MDNPLLPEPLRPGLIKPRLLALGHHAGAGPVHGHQKWVMPTAHWAGLAALRPNGQRRVSATSLANSDESPRAAASRPGGHAVDVVKPATGSGKAAPRAVALLLNVATTSPRTLS